MTASPHMFITHTYDIESGCDGCPFCACVVHNGCDDYECFYTHKPVTMTAPAPATCPLRLGPVTVQREVKCREGGTPTVCSTSQPGSTPAHHPPQERGL